MLSIKMFRGPHGQISAIAWMKTYLLIFVVISLLFADAERSKVQMKSPPMPVPNQPSIFMFCGPAIPYGLIIATSLCHLDLHPELKHFLTQPDGIDSYENVEVILLPGQRPALIVTCSERHDVSDEDAEGERTQLWHFKTQDEFHSLMKSIGFQQKQPKQLQPKQQTNKSPIQGIFHHSEAKRAYLEAKSQGKDTNQCSRAAMDAFLMSASRNVQSVYQQLGQQGTSTHYDGQEDDIAVAIHRRLREHEA